jgi:hypothetical protein
MDGRSGLVVSCRETSPFLTSFPPTGHKNTQTQRKNLPGLLYLSPLWALQKNDGATYFVATYGNDAHSCSQAQNRGTPKGSLNGVAACVHPGDTVRMIAGV